MRVRIAYTVEVDDETRELINRHLGKPGLADRDEVQQFYWRYGEYGSTILDDETD